LLSTIFNSGELPNKPRANRRNPFASRALSWGNFPNCGKAFWMKAVIMKTNEMTDEIQNGLGEFRQRITEKARDLSTATDRYVHENAWQSVAFAAVIGCVIGFLMGRRGD
jgi:hypothetical protein